MIAFFQVETTNHSLCQFIWHRQYICPFWFTQMIWEEWPPCFFFQFSQGSCSETAPLYIVNFSWLMSDGFYSGHSHHQRSPSWVSHQSTSSGRKSWHMRQWTQWFRKIARNCILQSQKIPASADAIANRFTNRLVPSAFTAMLSQWPGHHVLVLKSILFGIQRTLLSRWGTIRTDCPRDQQDLAKQTPGPCKVLRWILRTAVEVWVGLNSLIEFWVNSHSSC